MLNNGFNTPEDFEKLEKELNGQRESKKTDILLTDDPFITDINIDFYNYDITTIFKDFIVNLGDTINDMIELYQNKNVKEFNKEMNTVFQYELLNYIGYLNDSETFKKLTNYHKELIIMGLFRMYSKLIGVGEKTIIDNNDICPKFHYLKVIYLYNTMIQIEESIGGNHE